MVEIIEQIFKNDKLVREVVTEIPAEELADEAERKQIAGFIKGMSSSNTKKIFQYLQKKGLLP